MASFYPTYTQPTTPILFTAGWGDDFGGDFQGFLNGVITTSNVIATGIINTVFGITNAVKVNGVQAIAILSSVFGFSSQPRPTHVGQVQTLSKRISVRPTKQSTVRVAHAVDTRVVQTVDPDPTVGVHRVGLNAFLRTLQGVDIAGTLPNLALDDTQFNQDQRYKLIYDPVLKKWVAALEPIVTEVDGGTY